MAIWLFMRMRCQTLHMRTFDLLTDVQTDNLTWSFDCSLKRHKIKSLYGELFDILNYCILNGKFYIHKQKLFHENELYFYDYLWELKYKLQIERMICNGTSNDEQFSKFL